jgi:hypothetical protein
MVLHDVVVRVGNGPPTRSQTTPHYVRGFFVADCLHCQVIQQRSVSRRVHLPNFSTPRAFNATRFQRVEKERKITTWPLGTFDDIWVPAAATNESSRHETTFKTWGRENGSRNKWRYWNNIYHYKKKIKQNMGYNFSALNSIQRKITMPAVRVSQNPKSQIVDYSGTTPPIDSELK